MKAVGKLLALGSILAGGAILAVRFGNPWLRARRQPRAAVTSAGAMFVGAVDEVELGGGPMRGDRSPEGFDPEEVPSEHPEINELRNQMPFG